MDWKYLTYIPGYINYFAGPVVLFVILFWLTKASKRASQQAVLYEESISMHREQVQLHRDTNELLRSVIAELGKVNKTE
ncbi:MAG TPA: hypothetical protein V6C81_02195 [Planktothrix sp.]|jgi:hypothetical protein